jgi:CubicO group peptidase (beta-lactamase class C family)
LQRAGRDQSVLSYAREKFFDPLRIKTRPAYLKPPRLDTATDPLSTPGEQNSEYGLLWWIGLHSGHRSLEARGSYGQLIMVVPDRQLVVAVASSTTSTYSSEDPGVFVLADHLAALVLQLHVWTSARGGPIPARPS